MNILVSQTVTEAMKDRFASLFHGNTFVYAEDPSAEQFSEAEVIFGYPKPEMLSHSKKLRFLQLRSAGADLHNNAVPKDVAVCCTTGVYGRELGEALLGYLLALTKHLHIYRDSQAEHKWEFYDFNRSVAGSRVLILGLGDIGMNFAKLLEPFNCHITGVRRTRGDCPDCVHEVRTMDELDELLPEADVVAMCLPNTPLTQGMMSRERIFAMKQGSILMNVGRGNALDTMALCDAVTSGHLWGAAIDVVEPEPLPSDHPIWDAQNIIITPHSAGRSYGPYVIERTVEVFIQNLTAFFAGEPFITPVDRETGYMVSRR